MYARFTLPGAMIVVLTLTACDLKRQPLDPTSSPIASVVVRPESIALDPQQTQSFHAYGVTAAGDTVPATVSWSATGGSVSSRGVYTADTTASDGVVTATLSTAPLSGSSHVKKRRLVQVIVTPSTASVQAGQTQQFSAYGRANTGDSVAVNVSYSATGGTITSSGMYTAGSTPGTFRVIGRESSTSLQDTSVVAVTSAPPPPPGSPGTVNNLSVAGVTDSSVTLSFTEVTDGTGQPASYDIRWAAGTISWGTATPVARGTCTTPVAGSAVGATKTCTVGGLAAGTAYQFLAVAFRGTLNVDAVFGSQSNVASGTTAASTAPVATVTVSPATGSVAIGQTLQLVATAKDAAGNTLTGRAITWSSGAPLLATVNGSGLVSGLVLGLAPITATSEGKSGSSSITVVLLPPPPTTLFSNEPSGMTLIQESSWETGLLGSWFRKFTSTDKPITIVPITDSPIGQGQALQIGFNAGHVGGGGTELEYDIPTLLQPREMFVGYYVQVSSNWQGHSSGINKMVYLDDGGSQFSAMWYEMFGSGSSALGLYVVNQSGGSPAGMHENVQAVNFTRGVWHKVEIYQKQGSPGIIRVWVDGIPAIDRSDVYTKDAAIGMVTISGIWGGIGDVKQHFDYMRFDHIRISGR